MTMTTQDLREPLLGRGTAPVQPSSRADAVVRKDGAASGAATEGRGTPLSSAINLAATAMGTGVLTLPYAFAQCGPVRSLLLLAVLAVTTDITLVLLVRTGRSMGLTSFGAIMRKLFGDVGSRGFEAMMATVLFLALTAMQRVVLDLLPMSLEEALSMRSGSVDPVMVSGVVNIMVLAACLSRNYHSLRFTSGAALICLVPFIAALLQKALAAAFDPATALPPPVSMSASLEGALLAAPLLASSLCCHFSILDIDNELEARHRDKIYGVIHGVSLGVLPAVYAAVALAGVSLFGALTKENVLMAFRGDKLMEVVRGILSLTNALRMPLIAVPLFRILSELVGRTGGKNEEKAYDRPVGMPVLLLLSMAAAHKMHTLTRVMGLLGGTCGVLGCYCLPGLMYLALWRSGATVSRGWCAASVSAVIIGGMVLVASLFSCT